MSYVKHHAIVIQGSYGDWLERAHTTATGLFEWVSPISPEQSNGCRSFFIPPDGSKEGWAESNLGDDKRMAFKRWLRAQAYDDGSSPLDWVEVCFGDCEASVADDSKAHVAVQESDNA